jgi:hypothetical protein
MSVHGCVQTLLFQRILTIGQLQALLIFFGADLLNAVAHNSNGNQAQSHQHEQDKPPGSIIGLIDFESVGSGVAVVDLVLFLHTFVFGNVERHNCSAIPNVWVSDDAYMADSSSRVKA